ncbi:MAG: DUF6502 family protein [Pseudomonadales bacterium]|jgi:hypothetical protein|nr:DUF6502 family protein [Pseudomonadales bacterium]
MINAALQSAIARVLRPLVRVLLRHGFSHGDFNEIAKPVFVEVADSDFRLPGRKQTNARVAMLTGIQRKETGRLMALDPVEGDELDQQYNRGVRITAGWRRDSDFLNAAGDPAPLAFDGEAGFSELVRRYSGDLPARAVLDELRRVGTVSQDKDGMITLLPDGVHTPLADVEAQINIMGNAGKDLLSTIDHNLQHTDKYLQLTVAYNNLPLTAARRFQHISHEESLQLLKRFDAWLAEHDRDSNPGMSEEDGRVRAGIGIYYFEEDMR